MSNRESTVAEIVGPWTGGSSTSLLERCKDHWTTPIPQLPDLVIATFLDQGIAVDAVLAEAALRLKSKDRDDTELFDGQLKEAFESAKNSLV